VRVLWAGLVSDYFYVSNGVKQGGVISPILFCVYIDDLLLILSSLGVGCYLGLNFVEALTSSYLHQFHLLCVYFFRLLRDSYAAEYDVNFNPDKSNFFVIPVTKRRH